MNSLTVEPTVIDPTVPWVDEGDISVPGSDSPTPEGERIAARVGKLIGMNPDRHRKNGTPPPRKAPKPIPPKPRPGQLVKPFTDLYVTVGTMMLPFDQVCGMAVVSSAPKCAEALEQLARENPAVRRALMAMVETSVWGAVLAAHAPILLAVAMHHVPAIRESIPTPHAAAPRAEDHE